MLDPMQGPVTAAQQAILDDPWFHTFADRGLDRFLAVTPGLPRPTWDEKPVPYTTKVEWFAPRIALFKATDGARRELCVRERLCGFCGLRLDVAVLLSHAGGIKPGAPVMERVGYHERCTRVILRWCPALAAMDLVSWTLPADQMQLELLSECRSSVLQPDASPEVVHKN